MNQPYTLETLAALEEIKAHKARYTVFLDAHAWDLVEEMFVPDAVFSGDVSAGETHGAAAFVKELRERRGTDRMIHAATPLVVELVTPDTARGLWRFETILGTWGFYEDEFVRLDGSWKISALRLTWLQPPRLQRAGDYEDAEAKLAALAVRWTS
jgi:hypothetical protein